MRQSMFLSIVILGLQPGAVGQETIKKALHLGGGQKFAMKAASIVPSAKGEAIVGRDKNGNTTIELKVDHLARPDKLNPPKNAYVVWLRPRQGNGPENKGELRVDADLKGEFKTETAYRDFDIFVTAEDNAQAKAPSDLEVLSTSVQV